VTLRILQLIETGGPGGAETVFASLSEALANRGHAVHCMTGRGSWLPDELARRQLDVELLNFRGAFDTKLFAQIGRAIDRHEIDVLHAHLFDGAVYAAAAARAKGIPCVVTLHGQVDVRAAGWKGALKRRVLMQCATRIVTVSAALRGDLAAAFGTGASRFDVIHNGVAVLGADSPPTPLRDRSMNETPDAPWRLLAVGNIREPKGYPYLLEAMAILGQRGLSARLDIVGEPDREGLFEALQAQAAALGVSESVRFLGFVDRPAALIAASDVLVLASTKEGFSLVTIEAMALGTPVVATRSGGPEEILVDGETGFLVPAGRAEALADGIVRAMSVPAHTSKIVAQAHDDARRRFSLETMVDAYEARYGRVITGTD